MAVSQKIFFAVILENNVFLKKIFYMKNIQNLIPYKKVYIDFCHQTTPFLQNGHVMNAKIHHFSVRLHVLGRTTQAQLPSFTFMALYSRRLWYNSS